MTAELILTLADRSMGNYRIIMNMADELLTESIKRGISQLDQQLFLERFDFNQKKAKARSKRWKARELVRISDMIQRFEMKIRDVINSNWLEDDLEHHDDRLDAEGQVF